MLDAAARRRNDILETGEDFTEQGFRPGRADLVPLVGHGLTATGLVFRVLDLDPEPLQQFEGGDTDLRINCVDVAGNKQGDLHG